MEMIHNAICSEYVTSQTAWKYSELISGLQLARQKVCVVGEEIKSLHASIEHFSLQWHECHTNKSHMNSLQQSFASSTNECRDMIPQLRSQMTTDQPKDTEWDMNAHVLLITHAEMELVDHIKENFKTLGQLQTQVLDGELNKWKREQQLSGNGVPMQTNLDTIQGWCELLADLIWTTRQQVKVVSCINAKTMTELRQPHLTAILEDMIYQVNTLLLTLVTSTFVIEKQPPQVMKTNMRFSAAVRLLVGGQLKVYMTPPSVSVAIISEEQAQRLMESNTQVGEVEELVSCGDILNNIGTMEYQQTSRQLSVTFRNMQLLKIRRSGKKSVESMVDEKMSLFFQTQFKVGEDLVFKVWALSVPVVAIDLSRLEPLGCATVTWDNAFSAPVRVPFAVPDKVTWGQLAETLSMKFKSETGRHLSDDNLWFLAEKIFRRELTMGVVELDSMTISWAQFCKDLLPACHYTFYEWFHMVVKVTRDCLRSLWYNGLIIGFIQKKQAEEMLSNYPLGTFLLRFSDSVLGGITIAGTTEGNQVFNIKPFTSHDLMYRSLADRLFEFTQLQFLYPNIPKKEAFSKYCTKPENEMLKSSYVNPVLVATLPPCMSSSSTHSLDSHRNTPSVQSRSHADSTSSELDEDIRDFEQNDNPMRDE